MKTPEKRTAGLPTIKRLPLYLRTLEEMAAAGAEYASGAFVAQQLGLDPIVVRKDLAITGVAGRPRLGFPVNDLITAIQEFLGWRNHYDAVLVGVGSLGSALLRYEGFKQHGLRIVVAFDCRRAVIGKCINKVKVEPSDQIARITRRLHAQMAILTVPAESAQGAADQLVAGGIRGIWNFTPVRLHVPDHVILQREDLAASLAVLSHKLYL
jgi:redox-sensing transcriptional repressor